MGSEMCIRDRLTGASDNAPFSSANLASFLLFDKRFCRDLIELGYRDGQSQSRQIERFFEKESGAEESAP